MTNENIKVLVMEDNPADAEMIREMMQESAPGMMELENADTLAGGLKLLAADSYSAVLLDLGLPDSKGLNTLGTVLNKFPALPVIVLTGLADESAGVEAVKRGAQDYLVKGQVNWWALYSSIVYSIERKQMDNRLQNALTQQRRIVKGTVEALVSLIELRDYPNAVHQRHVARLAGLIAEELEYPPDRVDFVRTASVLHDIGKAAVPTEILNKPGGLVGLELDLERSHVQAGYDVLKGIEFPWPVAEVVLQHHERLDGSGFPRQLSGARILQEARILIVANIMDAMSTPRPWRDETPGPEKALEKIISGRGTLFDAAVVDACVKLFKQRDFAFE